MRAKVFDKFQFFNSHPLVFIRQLIGFCEIIVNQLSCPEDGNSSSFETLDFKFSP